MHAALAFVNGAGSSDKSLRLLKTLLSTSSDEGKSVDTGKSRDERQAEEESRVEPIGKPDGFKNDPSDPTNPNEVRERHLKKIKR